LEALSAAKYTFCVVAAEEDYEAISDAVSLGSARRPPSVEEILKLFRNPAESGVINLTGLTAAERQSFLETLLPPFSELRQATGRPHWLVIDSDFPAGFSWGTPNFPAGSRKSANRRNSAARSAPEEGGALGPSVLQITTRPKLLPSPVLAGVNLLIVTGSSPEQMIQEFCQMTATPAPAMDPVSLRSGEALAWRPQARNMAPFRLRIKPPKR
jgi:hypothetical protein